MAASNVHLNELMADPCVRVHSNGEPVWPHTFRLHEGAYRRTHKNNRRFHLRLKSRECSSAWMTCLESRCMIREIKYILREHAAKLSKCAGIPFYNLWPSTKRYILATARFLFSAKNIQRWHIIYQGKRQKSKKIGIIALFYSSTVRIQHCVF